MRRIPVFAVLLALSSAIPSFAATRSWTGGGTTNNWSDAANWNGPVPVAGDTLVFPAGASRLSNTNDLAAGLMFQSITVSGYGYVIGGNTIGLTAGLSESTGSVTLNAPLKLGAAQTLGFTSSATINSAIDLNGSNLTIAGYGTDFNGVISGSGGVTLTGNEAHLKGNNTYTGPTTIQTWGGISGSQPQSDVTVSAFNGQMFGAGGVVGNVIVNGELAPGGHSPCCGYNGVGLLSTKNLTFSNGSGFSSVDISGAAPGTGYDQVKVTGAVTIGTNVNIFLYVSNFSPSSGQVFTLIDNDGADPVSGRFRTIVAGASVPLDEGATVTLNGVYPFRISYAGGDGNDVTLTCLSGPKSWTGAVNNLWSNGGNWNGGIAPVAGDTLVFPSAAANQNNTNDLAAGLMFESITVSGYGYVISGNTIGLTAGLNESTGSVTLNAPLKLGATQTFSFTSSATINSAIDLNGSNLTIAGYGTDVNGVISGSGGVTLTSNETHLKGNNTYTGPTTIQTWGGISGSQPQSDVTVSAFNGQMFGAGGVVGNVIVNGELAPGGHSPCCGYNGVGLLSTKNLTFSNGSSFSQVDISGAAPGTGYDQVKVAGTVTIGTNVNIFMSVSFFSPSSGQVFTLIDNDGTDAVSGRFRTIVAGASVPLDEGATLTLNGVYPFRISYAGGDGNDVTLTCLSGPKSWTGAVNNLWSNGGNWNGGIAPVAGDTLVFPSAAANQNNTNDLAAGLMFESITISGYGYVIGGNTIGLTAGLNESIGSVTLNAPLKLGATQTFSFTSSATINSAIDLNGSNLTIAGYGTDVNGVISGSGGVTLTSNEAHLKGNNTYTGPTTIQTWGGISGSQPQSDVTVSAFSGQMFGAGGVVGNVIVNGELAPGGHSPCCGPNGVGLLSTKNLTFNNGSSFSQIDISGVAPGTGYDQVRVAGTVTIGTNVNIFMNVSSFSPTAGQVFTLIDNDGTDPVSGRFRTFVAGASVPLEEGATVTLNGVYPFRVSYAGGDGNDVTLAVLLDTTAGLSQSAATSTFGEPVTLTTTISAPSGTPTGSVMFTSDGATIGTVPVVNGVATLTTTTLAVGTHSIVASFLGTGAFADSVSGSVSHLITPGQTKTQIAADHPNSQYGQTIHFTVTVIAQAPASGQPGGSVTVLADGNAIGTVPVVNGVAAFETASFHPGLKSITATYSGDANFDGSTALAVQQLVSKAQTHVDASAGSRLIGASPLINVSVNVPARPDFVPSGTVSITDVGTTLGTQPLTGGVTTVTLSPMSAGDHRLIVNYSGDADFEASNATVIQSITVPSVSFQGTRVIEGNRGVTVASIVVSLSAPVSQTVRVSFSTVAGSAAEGEDYEKASGVIEFAPGEVTRSIELHILGDAIAEADETFLLLLSDPVNATIDTPSAAVVIANDDQVPPRRRPSRH